MKSISLDEFNKFISLREEIKKLIIKKTIELSLIINGRYPEGILSDDDFEVSNGKICVQFEYSSCDDNDYQTFQLPVEFLYDESYPQKYKSIYEEEQRKILEEKEKKCILKEEQKKKKANEFEQKEYERLKKKFEAVV